MNDSSIVIGIAGGTGSGKTFLANELLKKYGNNKIIIIKQDSYYRDIKNIPIAERNKQNFDHPDSIDINFFTKQLMDLIKGKAINAPAYNFKVHARSNKKTIIKSSKIIVIEGILILHFKQLRKLINIKVFVNTPDSERFKRRLRRDINERGRTIKSIENQYLTSVQPMHKKYIAPSKKFADIIIAGNSKNKKDINNLFYKINTLVNQDKV